MSVGVPLWLAASAAGVAAAPALVASVNLRLYRRSDPAAPVPPGSGPTGSGPAGDGPPRVLVCVPARNEAANIEACARGVLENDHPAARVVVYDDQSSDETPAIVERLASADARVLRAPTVPLPAGWSGKQHACWRMGEAALAGTLRRADGSVEPPLREDEWLLFTDADVRFTPDALRRSVAEAARLRVDLLSSFPRQLTGTLAEAALVPMMFYLLLGYLPMWRMRQNKDWASAAGCGQFLLVTARAYRGSGGHSAFKASYHDGIRMPRSVRRAGFRTDLFDGTDIASVRMYRGFAQTWRGFAKNAYEGLGSPLLLVVLTVMHALGHLLPWVALPVAVWAAAGAAGGAAGGAARADWEPWVSVGLLALAAGVPIWLRLRLARRFGTSPAGAWLHPLGVLGMTLIQWHSFVLHLTGRRSWKGRVLGEGAAGGGPAA